eukprot:GHVS01009988.1.p1 GENE.GHVS01009988.1~~GHVS01009988.1.p1  ORF type:complete len:141 (+),score=14.91 GHVS01009988.1:94-516(+)
MCASNTHMCASNPDMCASNTHMCASNTDMCAMSVLSSTHRSTFWCSNFMCGSLLLCTSVCLFLYYTMWIFVTPFLEVNQSCVLEFFPDRWIGVTLPCYVFMFVLVMVLLFMFVLITSEQHKEQQEGRSRARERVVFRKSL